MAVAEEFCEASYGVRDSIPIGQAARELCGCDMLSHSPPISQSHCHIFQFLCYSSPAYSIPDHPSMLTPLTYHGIVP